MRLNLQVEEVQQRLQGHVDADAVGHEEGQGTSGLGNDHHGIDDTVHDTRDSRNTDQHNGQASGRIRQHVQEAGNEEGQHILQVVEMGTTHTLHMGIVQLHLQLLRGQILGIGKGLERGEIVLFQFKAIFDRLDLKLI